MKNSILLLLLASCCAMGQTKDPRVAIYEKGDTTVLIFNHDVQIFVTKCGVMNEVHPPIEVEHRLMARMYRKCVAEKEAMNREFINYQKKVQKDINKALSFLK
jgi:pyrimidine deaminase RibD-like protein